MNTRIKIITYENGIQEYIPQRRLSFLCFHWWVGFNGYSPTTNDKSPIICYSLKEAQKFLLGVKCDIVDINYNYD